MAGVPGPAQHDGTRLADALRAGDVIALTEVYDAYAPRLYDYCHGLLRDRVEAAGALRNVIIAAREHVGRLTEPERLRGWLYAIARKECMRRRDSPNRHTGQEAPEADDGLSGERLALREERRMLAHSALAALNGRQREAIDLLVRHGLDEVDMAGIFGIPLEETFALVEKAGEDLAAALNAALIAQNHRHACETVASLAESWPLIPQAAASLVRHVPGCPVCGQLRTPQVSPARLLSVLPVAALPAELRLDVLTAATDEDRAGNRRAIAAWAEPFDEYGWPLPYEPAPARTRERPTRRRGPLVGALAVAVGVVMLSAGGMAWLGGGSGERTSAAGSVPAAPADSGEPTGPGAPEPTPTDPSSTATSPSPSPSETPSATASATRTRASRTPSSLPPLQPPPGSDTPQPSTPGSLAVEGCSMDGRQSCNVRITAQGGPVDWRVTGTSGGVSASGAGRLEPGESAEVTVRRSNLFCLGERTGWVSFSPGGTARVSYC
ncbi:MAG: hypothetical protein FWJ90_03555 [Actinomadura sp.]